MLYRSSLWIFFYHVAFCSVTKSYLLIATSWSLQAPLPYTFSRIEKVLVAQTCPTLYNSVNCSLPGSCVRGIFQARILKWVSFPSPETFPTQELNPDLLDCKQIFYWAIREAHYLLEFAQIHESVMLSNRLILCSPFSFCLFNLYQHQGLFQWVSSSESGGHSIGSFSFSSPSNEYSGLIFFS